MYMHSVYTVYIYIYILGVGIFRHFTIRFQSDSWSTPPPPPPQLILLCKYIFTTLHFNQNCRFYAFCL